MDRETAWQIVCEFVKDPGLRRHMQAVEAAMRFYAQKLSGNEDEWGLAGLLHDFDWEIHPNLADHPAKGAAILRERGVGEPIITAILSHNPPSTGVNPAAPMDFALSACDEITGMIVATTLVRPTRDIREVEVKSIRKKWRDRSFAAGVHREEAEKAAADFSQACFQGQLEFWDHVGNVLEGMKRHAAEMNLAGGSA